MKVRDFCKTEVVTASRGASLRGARPEGIRVGDAMSTRVACAREDDGVFEAVRTMAERGVRRLAVVAAGGTLRGMVTLDDILVVLAREMANVTHALKLAGEREAIQHRILDVLAGPV